MPHNHEPSPESAVCRTAHFTTTWAEPTTAVVAVRGELDAANGLGFVDYALRHAGTMQRLVVDLSGLTFFSTAGFSALHTLNVRCVGQDIRWVLVPGNAVNRLLRICDPDAALPVCADADDAISAVHTAPPRLFELVAEPR